MARCDGRTLASCLAGTRAIATALALGVLCLLAVVAPAGQARAADSPSVDNPVYFQTQGPDDLIGYGDYYSASVPQGGAATDHMITFATPLEWPSALPVTVAIYDPESWGGVLSSGLPAGDEVRGTTNSTAFWIVEQPSGTTIASKTYAAGASATHGTWDQVVTFVPAPGATYEIHTTTGGDDENSWRARVSYDPDCAVGVGTCTAAQLDNGNQVDNVDGASGTGDEIYLNAVRVAYQHDRATDVCNNHFFFVPDTMVSVTMRNFDLDLTGSITYTRGDGSTVSGTPSASGAWAVDTITVGAGQSGWWTATFCYNASNLYVFESTQNLRLYMDERPGAPALAVTKTDGVTTARWGERLDYTVNVANTSDSAPHPGSAVAVVVRDALPAGLEFASCSMGGAAGTCSESGGVVTWTLTGTLAAGSDVDLGVSTTVAWGFTGTVTNTAIADFSDVYGNNYPDVSGSDTADTIEPARLAVTKTSSAAGELVAPGSRIDYTVVVDNPTTSTHTGVTLTDALPTGTTYVPGSTVVTLPAPPVTETAIDDFASTSYGGGTGWTGPWVDVRPVGSAQPCFMNAQWGALAIGWEGCVIERTVNVADATSATLSFTLGTRSGQGQGMFDPMEPDDSVGWGVSVDGGAYQQIGSLAGEANPDPGTYTLDLSSFLPANEVTVSFRGLTGIMGGGEWYLFDDVELTTSTPAAPIVLTNATSGTLASGVPGTLVTEADGVDLPAGAHMTVTYSVIVNDPVASPTQRFITNTALAASAEDPAGSIGAVTDELDRTPVLGVVKTGPASAVFGDTVTYGFTVSHAAESDGSPVSGVTISDDVAGTPAYVSGDDGDGLLEAGETWTYIASYAVTGSEPSPLVNTVTVGGTDLNGEPIPGATARHSMAVNAPAPSISLTKTTPVTDFSLGDDLVYTLTATNTGNVPLTGVTLTDSLAGAEFVGACDPVALAPGASRDCMVTYEATAADVAAARITNSASVTGLPSTGPAVSDTASVTVTGADAPAIGVVVTVDSRNYFVAGQRLNFTVVATNTGPVTLHRAQVDSVLAGADTADCDALDEVLDPGESMTCDVSYVVKAADMDVTELALDVVARGESATEARVTAQGRRNTVPVVALAFTGFEASEPSGLAALLLAAGGLVLVVRRRRQRRSR